MASNGDSGVLVLILIFSVLSCCAGGLLQGAQSERTWRAEAIKHHAGHYDPETAKFVWNDEVKVEK